eukprot:gene1026-348_t
MAAPMIARPSIAPDQSLNGFLLHRIFKNKTVYVRPSATLLDLNDEPVDKMYKIDDSDDEEPDFPPFGQKDFSVKATEAARSNEAVDYKTFVRDAVRLEENECASFGKIVALSLLNGYPEPHNFCSTRAKNILSSEENDYSIHDIPDYDVKERVQILLE